MRGCNRRGCHFFQWYSFLPLRVQIRLHLVFSFLPLLLRGPPDPLDLVLMVRFWSSTHTLKMFGVGTLIQKCFFLLFLCIKIYSVRIIMMLSCFPCHKIIRQHCARCFYHSPHWWQHFEQKYQSAKHKLYSDIPLHNANNRGVIIENFCRTWYEENIGPTEDVPQNLRPTRRGPPPFDFCGINRERVEVKHSSFITHNATRNGLHFSHIRLDEYDRLLLFGYFPDRHIIWEYDMNKKFGFSQSRSNPIEGDAIRVTISAKEHWSKLKQLELRVGS